MSYLFDGNDYLERTVAVKATTPVTVAAWVKPNALTTVQAVMWLGVLGSINNAFGLRLLGGVVGNPVRAEARVTSGGNAETTVPYQAGVWQHVCGVFTSTTSRSVLLGGANKVSNVESRTPAGLNRTRIGADVTAASPMDGRIAEAAVWSVALSDSDVAALAAGAVPSSVQPAGVVSYWPLRNNAEDEVGIYDLTVVGATLDADNPQVGVTDVQTAYPLGGLGRTTEGKLVLTTGGTAQAHRTQGFLTAASGAIQVATSGTTAGYVHGWEVDSNGKLLVATTGAVANRVNGLAVTSTGRVLVDTGAVSYWENGLARTSDGKVAVQLNTG